MVEQVRMSRRGVLYSTFVAGALTVGAAVAVASFVYRPNKEVDPLLVADFNRDGRNEILYKEELVERTYGLFLIDGEDVIDKVNGRYIVRGRGKELARGLPSTASVDAGDENRDENLDVTIRVDGQYDVLLGDGNLGFTLAPRGAVAKRR